MLFIPWFRCLTSHIWDPPAPSPPLLAAPMQFIPCPTTPTPAGYFFADLEQGVMPKSELKVLCTGKNSK